MKKMLSLLLAGVILVGLVSCDTGSEAQDQQSDTESIKVTETESVSEPVSDTEQEESSETVEDTETEVNKNEGLDKAPDIKMYDLNGKVVNLSDYFGKPIVLNFWASWCPPCKAEMPEFQEVYDELGGEVVFLMVNRMDGVHETVRTVSTFLGQNQYTFPIFLDKLNEGPQKYGVEYIPYTFFINEDGYIVSKVNNGMGKDSLLSEIAKIYTPEAQ